MRRLKPWEYPIVRVPRKRGGYRTLHHPHLMEGCRARADIEGWVALIVSGGIGWVLIGQGWHALGLLCFAGTALAVLKLYVSGKAWVRDDAIYFEHTKDHFQGANTMMNLEVKKSLQAPNPETGVCDMCRADGVKVWDVSKYLCDSCLNKVFGPPPTGGAS